MKGNQRDLLTDHLNSMDMSGSIRFIDEPEVGGRIPFLDALVTRKSDGSIKVQVYRNKTHTDQFLNFKSHYSLQQTLGIIRTLYDRCDNIVTDPKDVKAGVQHVNKALGKCRYPSWTFKKG